MAITTLRKGWRLVVSAVSLSLLIACGGGGADVNWENYDPSVRERIDSMAEAGDCEGLQQEFNTAETNSDMQRARVGEGNADLMGYIDEQLRAAGCYDDE